jgi:DNA-binding PadR family transcriptional regulator
MNDLLLLALMLGGPKYGYQLKREAGWMSGQDALHNNIVYPMLRRFSDEGWVSKKTVPGERGQIRQQHALTAAGRRILMDRLSQFSEADASMKEAFRLRIGVFSFLKPDIRESILTAREQRLERQDERLGALQGNIDLGKFGGEIIRYMRKEITMEQEWIQRLRRMAKATPRG